MITQLVHILKKDIRYTRWELGLYFLLSIAYVWQQVRRATDIANIQQLFGYGRWASGSQPPRSPETLFLVLLGLVAVYLIVRVIHAEAIPGDNRFWFTRPYDWKSLLVEKVVFILLLVDLPMFLARMIAIRALGFPLSPAVWHVLSLQIELTLILALPVAAVATLTSGLAQFVLVVFLSIPAAAIVIGDASWFNEWAPGEAWIRAAIAAVALIAVSAWAVIAQYRNRRTGTVRVAAVLGLVAASFAYVFTPVSMAMDLNAWLAQPMSDMSIPRAVVGPEVRVIPRSTTEFAVQIPATVQDIPAGATALIDRMFVDFTGSGETIKQWMTISPTTTSSGALSFLATGRIPRSFFDAEDGKPVTVRVSVDAFYFATTQSQDVHRTDRFENVVGGLRCRGGHFLDLEQRPTFYEVDCMVPAVVQDLMIQVNSGESKLWYSRPWIPSYSFFPSGDVFELESVEWHEAAGVARNLNDVTISVSGPPQRLHRDFEFHDVTMATTMKLH